MTLIMDKENFRPWEKEEGRKRKPSRGDSVPPKTGMLARLHSKPKVSGQEYLDMYIMLKQKERTEKYGDTLFKRQQAVTEEWDTIREDLEKAEEELPEIPKFGSEDSEEPGTRSKRRKSRKLPRHMKRIDWSY